MGLRSAADAAGSLIGARATLSANPLRRQHSPASGQIREVSRRRSHLSLIGFGFMAFKSADQLSGRPDLRRLASLPATRLAEPGRLASVECAKSLSWPLVLSRLIANTFSPPDAAASSMPLAATAEPTRVETRRGEASPFGST